MKITPKQEPKKSAKFLQQGGTMPVQEPAPAPAGGEDPMMILAQMAAQALQTQDCQIAMQVCQALMEMLQGAAAPAPEAEGEPVFAKGGRLLRRIKK